VTVFVAATDLQPGVVVTTSEGFQVCGPVPFTPLWSRVYVYLWVTGLATVLRTPSPKSQAHAVTDPGVAEAVNVTFSVKLCLPPSAGFGLVVIVITGVTQATVVVELVEVDELVVVDVVVVDVVVVVVEDVEVDVDVTTDATWGFSTGAVAEVVSVNEPPKRFPISGVRKVNGWLTVTVTSFPVPVAKLEATLQSTDVDGADGEKQKGDATATVPPPLCPCAFACATAAFAEPALKVVAS
jgi:hypothetical protein